MWDEFYHHSHDTHTLICNAMFASGANLTAQMSDVTCEHQSGLLIVKEKKLDSELNCLKAKILLKSEILYRISQKCIISMTLYLLS